MFDDLIKLIDAGFTHDEIMQLTGGSPAAPQEAAPAEDQAAGSEPEAVNETAPESSPEAAPEGSGETDYITTLRTEINDLRKLIQRQNVMTAEQQPLRTTQKTDTDIIANIIKGG